jgi:hypothetical protein
VGGGGGAKHVRLKYPERKICRELVLSERIKAIICINATNEIIAKYLFKIN